MSSYAANIRAMEPFVWLLQVSGYKFDRESAINDSIIIIIIIIFSLLRSAIMCICGARSSFRCPIAEAPIAVQVAEALI